MLHDLLQRASVGCLLVLLAACQSEAEHTFPPPASPVASNTPIAPTPAAVAEVAPAPAPTLHPPLTEYMGRSIAQTMHWTAAPWLVRESREAEENATRMLLALGVEEGSTVCDFGCGNGYHTLELARMVGSRGRVLAVDIQPEMLEMLSERAEESGLANVEPILGEEADPRLPPSSCDLVLMADVYHELAYPEEILAAAKRALRPGGRLALLEFRTEDPLVPIKPEHRMSKAQVERELVANGFRLIASFDELPWQHLLFFETAP